MLVVSDLTNCLSRLGIEFLVYGDENAKIEGFCSLNAPRNNCLAWARDPNKAEMKLLKAVAAPVLITPDEVLDLPEGSAQIVVNDPRRVFFTLLDEFFTQNFGNSAISPAATVLSNDIGEGVSIDAHAFIGPDVIIGAGTRIGSNVSIICPCEIGENCILWPGVVIGSDGFGFWKDEGGVSHKVPHYGGVCIGDEVEIGANACIDRGTLDNTVIGNGVKIDNLVHIAHNCHIGANVNVVSQSGLSGSVHLGDGAYIAPHSVVLNQLEIGVDAFVGLGSVVIRDIQDGGKVFGNPAKQMRI